jgi:hypothetical protein
METFLAIAFLAGILSCASTCFLPLVPAYHGGLDPMPGFEPTTRYFTDQAAIEFRPQL